MHTCTHVYMITHLVRAGRGREGKLRQTGQVDFFSPCCVEHVASLHVVLYLTAP